MAAGLGEKRTQSLPRAELQRLLAVARGDQPADLLFRNVRILDLVNGECKKSAVSISAAYIAGTGMEYADADARVTVDGHDRVVTPGFIDAHLHVESSMMQPFEFERLTLPLGTTTAICDPHEITNVMGDAGYQWFLRCAEKMHQNLFVQTSSCVPALPGFETNGGEYALKDMLAHQDHPNVLGLAEMMNFPGVINGDEAVLDKLAAYQGMNIDGHCPLLQGKPLNAYIAAGVQNCHETIGVDEGAEKLAKGMALIIREGSVAKNLTTLAPLVTEFNSEQCLLCTDDRNPYEIFNEGHIDYLVRRLIGESHVPAHVAYRLATFSAAQHFGLQRLGLIAPVRRADLILLDDLEKVAIHKVFCAGQDVDYLQLDQQVAAKLRASKPPESNTILRSPMSASDFEYDLQAGRYNVIGIIEHEIITQHLKLAFDGMQFDAPDVLRIANIERYGHGLPPALGLVKGTGMQRGAIAASVAHDSHNLIVIGADPTSMACAVNALIDCAGGICVVDNGQVSALLKLPIAGLMSAEPAARISARVADLKSAYRKLGGTLAEPFLQMAFLALPVIPSLKLTDRGLVDVTRFEFIDLRA